MIRRDGAFHCMRNALLCGIRLRGNHTDMSSKLKRCKMRAGEQRVVCQKNKTLNMEGAVYWLQASSNHHREIVGLYFGETPKRQKKNKNFHFKIHGQLNNVK